MSLQDEILALRKKRKQEEEKLTIEAPLFTNKTAAFFTNEAPVATKKTTTTTTTAKKDKEEEDERKWFEKGEFEDGYQFGDVFKTILGTARDVKENVSAGILGMGEKVVDTLATIAPYVAKGQYYQNGGAYQSLEQQKLFNDTIEAEKESLSAFVAKDLYDEEKVAKKILDYTSPSAPLERQLGVTADESSVLGEKSDALVQSAGQLGATIGLSAVGVPWWLTTGVTSFGAESENALQQGATLEEAAVSSMVSAGAEILTEKLSGAISFGGKALDDVVVKRIASGISNKTVRTMAKLGLDAAGEGTEEIVSQVFSNLGSALYKEKSLEELLTSEEAIDEYIESFIGGAVLGGGMGTINAISSGKQGVDYASGLNQQEQAVVEKIYNDRVAEEEKNGKLTQKQKSKIYDEVLSDMDKGYISTDSIEEILGGETYHEYQRAVNSEESLKRQFDALSQMKQGDMTGEQIDLRNELKQQMEEMQTKNERSQVQTRLRDEVFGLVQNSRLAESYNERGRKSQAFEADLSQYDTKYHETIKKAAESGILNNTRRTHEFVDMIAKISADKGVLFDFTNNAKLKESGFAVDGKTVNGYVTKDGVTLNIDSAKSLNSVTGHEITHVLEGTELYTELQKAVVEYAKSKGDYQGRYDSLSKLYANVKDADIDAELTADLVGDYIFSDTDFVNNLSVQHRNVFQKIYDEIKYLCKVATAGSKEARELEKVKRAFEKAYKESGKVAETKYSVSETTDGRFAAVVDSDILAKIDTQSWDDTKKAEAKKAAADALKQFSDGIVVDGITRKVNRTSRREYTRSKYTESLFNKAPEVFADKMRAAEVADDIVVAATDWSRDGGLKHQRADNFVDFDHGKTLIVSGDAKYSAEVVVGITDAGDAVFYDVVDMTPAEFDIKKEESPTTATTQKAIGDIQGDSFGPNVTQKGAGVKLSLSDSDGKQLTKGQQEYFKDSKMRDENGNLKVMYHGSQDAGFHVFDARHSDDHTSFFFVDRNDVAASYSGTYETYEAKSFRTVEDANKFFEKIGKDEYFVDEKNGKYRLRLDNGPYYFDIAESESIEELYNEFCEYEGVGYGDANYKVYLNLTNPLVVDAEGRNWDNISREFSQEGADRYQSLTAEEKSALSEAAEWEDFATFKDAIYGAIEKTNEEWLNEVPDPTIDDNARRISEAYKKLNVPNMYDLFSIASDNFSEEAIKQFAVKQMNTRDYAAKAKAEGYDGVIFQNIHDNGGYSNGSEGASTVAIAFSSEQIKSVANESPTADKDIRYSLSDGEYADTFYSQMGKVIDGVKQEKLGAASVVNMLRGKGVKAEEIKWSGIEQFLEGKKSVSKAELQEFIRSNQLEIEEETLDNKETPYSEEQSAKLAEYTEKHHATMDELAAEWERIVGSEFPLDRAANINSDDIERELTLAKAAAVNKTRIGQEFAAATNSVKAMIEANDNFGYDRMTQAYRSIVWNPESFIANFDVSAEDASVIREFAKIKRVVDEARAAATVSEQDIHKLKSLANSANAWSRKITDVKSEYYAEQAKRTTKWGQYKLGSGHNYREYLFKMPGSDYSNQAMAAHWGGERAGVLAHARVQDFETKDGTILFVEEVQSDWHNEGAKEGYADEHSKGFTELELGEYQVQSNGVPIAEVTDAYDNIVAYVMKHNGRYIVDKGNGQRFDTFQNEDDALAALKADAQYQAGTPDAPFRKNYHEYVMKRLVREAAEKGFDYIGWTSGELQENRWSSDYAEGYRIEYDQDIPKFMNKFGKNFGATAYRAELKGNPIWRMPITEAMKQSVLYEGQPMYSLSEEGEVPKGRGVFGKDIALATPETHGLSPLDKFKYEEVAPVSVADNATTTEDLFPDDLAPMETELERLYTEREALENQVQEAIAAQSQEDFENINARWVEVNARIEELERDGTDRTASLSDEDAPPDVAPYIPTAADEEFLHPSGEDAEPFEDRDIKDVGDRSVKAYMYENPEVKPFFQHEALVMLTELDASQKGERWVNWSDHNGGYGAESYYQFGGVKRDTSHDIAYLLDNVPNTSYDKIRAALNAIVEDNGRENNALSKRIEFILDERLRKGYENFGYPGRTEANQAYIDTVNRIESNAGAFDALVAHGDEYAPVAATTEESPVVAPAKAAPVKPVEAPVKGEAIKPEKPKAKSADILTEEPKVNKEKPGVWAMLKNTVLDKGMVFEDLALKTGDRELQARWNSIRYADARAQRFMEKGNASTSSLDSIRKAVEGTGKTKQFYEYLYHLHNADRMTLEDRYEDTENKPVFGYDVTADMSKQTAASLEKANPEFKQYAEDVYSYMSSLREMLVDGGVISRETANLWAEMYPHYVPVRRVGDEGLNINVALDTKRTGVNAPVKRATGGNRDILPLFDTMAQRTLQTYKAIAKNRFGVELKNLLGTTIDNEAMGIDEAVEGVNDGELLQEGKDGRNPTFTVFENGERVTFEISEEMYRAMKPTSDGLAYTNKVLNKANNIRRGLITEYNPAFMLTNPIKDAQDVLMNSQHPVKTYANFPKAIAELLGKKGHWYTEYMENGGEQNTYFENATNTFAKEKSGIVKVIGIPLEKISEANNFIERIPRMAEYIASRKEGRSVDVAMLDAARVTTNFAAGGDLTKLANRNGFTFLNASVQGAVQQVRNVREAKANGIKGVLALAGKIALAGLPAELLSHLLWDDDEDYAELSDYVKQNYYIVAKYGDGQFVRIPKGRTLAFIQDVFRRAGEIAANLDEMDAATLKKHVDGVWDMWRANLAPNNPLENNILAPIYQAKNNTTWYGEDLVPSRLQDLPAAEQYDESTDAISKWLGENLNVSPYKINYLLDQYSGAIGDMFLPMLTDEAESGDNSVLGNMLAPLKSKFTTDSVMNNQNVSDFYDMKDELNVKANASGATDEDVLRAKYMNSVSADFAKLYAAKREIQNSDMPDDEKYEAVRDIQKQIDMGMEDALNAYGDISYEEDYREGGKYARIGGTHPGDGGKMYKLDDEGEWQKLSAEQVTKYEVTKAAGDANYASDGENHYRWYVPGEDASDDAEAGWRKVTDKEYERQQEVTRALDISPEEYWSNREEYACAYDNPESYAVAKAVGGYEAYRTYSGELYDIKADKDEWGQSISGSRKEKVREYINNLDADYYTKIILWKSEYNSDDSNNMEIIDYLNGRDDISYEEMEAILLKLGFKVDGEGNISW